MVSPVGVGKQQFWDGLSLGKSGIGPIHRFDCSTFDVQVAGEVKEDIMLPDDVKRVAAEDPKVGYGFAAVCEALDQASVRELAGSSMLHLGASLEYFDLQKAIADGRADFRQIAQRCLMDGWPSLRIPLDTTVRMVVKHWGRPDRTLINCSACAAGAQAIGHAFREVRSGRCELAVCGGFDSMVNPLGIGGFQLLGALTTDNNRCASACRPFDASRSGTVLGEGAAAFVVEPLEKARANGKNILAEIRGYGSTLDAHSLSAPDPDGEGAARSMRMALEDAKLEPCDISHVNAHGTGTILNDEVEARAIRRVFSDCWDRIPVSATKSLTGHLIAAAGPVEVGACLLALTRNILPPNPWLSKTGTGCELTHVVQRQVQFNGDFVLSNSFGFGGQNATLILGRYSE